MAKIAPLTNEAYVEHWYRTSYAIFSGVPSHPIDWRAANYPRIFSFSCA